MRQIFYSDLTCKYTLWLIKIDDAFLKTQCDVIRFISNLKIISKSNRYTQ